MCIVLHSIIHTVYPYVNNVCVCSTYVFKSPLQISLHVLSPSHVNDFKIDSCSLISKKCLNITELS